ncbi:mannose-1-phosphate guanylyltransferase [Desulfosporosinus nitroreducens]|uniref:Mannose-1-phosphate guanylyltransferase n=1 Tax=Desulfosporosinus nitroreducens TaxID=2018668 RepID=A0ABT8QMH5_9FIRM|nr:mannose-1-phosphate guanylyltransferase [Desulfosporosinus nitroreducens]MDO0822533.1 mannose-1-phosphate guanylyltransferase [Desulfosporosinus nitroreducens]
MYIELKTGYGHNGPASIGRVKFSKSGRTIYFNSKAFKKYKGISGNYYDAETHEEYWISGVKENGSDRHWAGSGKILIDRKIVDEYLQITDQDTLDLKRFEVIDIPDEYPISRINQLENKR